MAIGDTAKLRLLEETLLVKVIDESVGTDALGNPKIMTMNREGYEAMKKDLKLEIIEVLKPEGYTMAQWNAEKANAAQQQKPANAAPAKAAAPSKTPAPAKAAAPAKPKGKAAPADKPPTDEELKAAIEEAGMKELLDKAQEESK